MAISKPSDIKAFLDRTVIGQERAKQHMANIGFIQHLKRLQMFSKQLEHRNVPLPSPNSWLIGPSGTGKTLLVSQLAKALGVPYMVIDANQLTPPGYKGTSFSEKLFYYIEDNGKTFNLNDLEHGIIFIDEFDKILVNTVSDGWSLMRQSTLLKVVEGGVNSIEREGFSRSDRQLFNTSNILFILGGSFESVRKDFKTKSKQIGFNANLTDTVDSTFSKRGLEKAGVLRELLGRIPGVTYTEPFSEKQLAPLLDDSLPIEGTSYEKYKNFFKLCGYNSAEPLISRQEKKRILKEVAKHPLGARALDDMLFNTLNKKLYNLEFLSIEEDHSNQNSGPKEADVAFIAQGVEKSLGVKKAFQSGLVSKFINSIDVCFIIEIGVNDKSIDLHTKDLVLNSDYKVYLAELGDPLASDDYMLDLIIDVSSDISVVGVRNGKLEIPESRQGGGRLFVIVEFLTSIDTGK